MTQASHPEAKIWEQFPRITLAEMKSVKLMNRTDTKFVAPRCALAEILRQALSKEYSVQYTDAVLNSYSTIYYDTEELEMYTQHHNRKLTRQKVRSRTYIESALSFLEIKNKNNRGRTKKIRITVPDTDTEKIKQNAEAVDFIEKNTKYLFNGLKPALITEFSRITLVNKEKTERITVDLNVNFFCFDHSSRSNLNDIIIIELKQDGRYVSTMRQILLDLRITPFKISKYCIGTALTNPDAKANRFKKKITLLKKLATKNYDTTT